MRYQTFLPPTSLHGIVKYFWVFEMDGIDGQEYHYRSMADGLAGIVFHIKGQFHEVKPNPFLRQADSMVHAQTAKFRRFVTYENFIVFGAYLYPTALPLLFGHSATSLSDEMPDLIALAGKSGRVLQSKILDCKSDFERIRVLQAFLEHRISKVAAQPSLGSQLVDQMILAKGQLRISDLAENAGLSVRSLERKFKSAAGFSPKRFARILRFQSAIGQYQSRFEDLTSLGLECGYYDQAHFIHDFKEFSGYTPSQYFLGSPEGIEFKEG